MQMGKAYADVLASALRMQNAPLSGLGKTLVLATLEVNLGTFAVARQTRRVFGPCGGVGRRDVVAAADEGADAS